jgi:hypothetical protein
VVAGKWRTRFCGELNGAAAERFGEGIRPNLTGDRKSFTYTAALKRIPEVTTPDIKNCSWSLTANVEVSPR